MKSISNQVEATSPTLKLVPKDDKRRAKLAAKLPTESNGHPVQWTGNVRYTIPAGSIVSAPNERGERTICVKLCGALSLVITTSEPIVAGKLAKKREMVGILQIFRHKQQVGSVQAVTFREQPCSSTELTLTVCPNELRLAGGVYGVQLVRCHLKVSRVKAIAKAQLAA